MFYNLFFQALQQSKSPIIATTKSISESLSSPGNDLLTSQPFSNSDRKWTSILSLTGSSGFAREIIATRSFLSSETPIEVYEALPTTQSIFESVSSSNHDALSIQPTSKPDATKTDTLLQASPSAVTSPSIATQSLVTSKTPSDITEARPTQSSISESAFSSSRNALTIHSSSNPDPVVSQSALQDCSSFVLCSDVGTERLLTLQTQNEIFEMEPASSRISESTSSLGNNALKSQVSLMPDPNLTTSILEERSSVLASSSIATERLVTSQAPSEVLGASIPVSVSSSSRHVFSSQPSSNSYPTDVSDVHEENSSLFASSNIATGSLLTPIMPNKTSETAPITSSIFESASSSSHDLLSIQPSSNSDATGVSPLLEESSSVSTASSITTESMVTSQAPSEDVNAIPTPSSISKSASSSSHDLLSIQPSSNPDSTGVSAVREESSSVQTASSITTEKLALEKTDMKFRNVFG